MEDEDESFLKKSGKGLLPSILRWTAFSASESVETKGTTISEWNRPGGLPSVGTTSPSPPPKASVSVGGSERRRSGMAVALLNERFDNAQGMLFLIIPFMQDRPPKGGEIDDRSAIFSSSRLYGDAQRYTDEMFMYGFLG